VVALAVVGLVLGAVVVVAIVVVVDPRAKPPPLLSPLTLTPDPTAFFLPHPTATKATNTSTDAITARRFTLLSLNA
jgi:hypothetical protein